MKLDVAEKYQSLQNRTNTSKAIATIFQTDSLEPSEYWSHFNVTKTLKSFVLQHSGNNSVCLDEQMTQFIQKIIKTSNRNLRCFWTSIPTLEVDKSIFDWKAMIAWNHSEITSNLPSIESYVGNLFPEHNAPYGDLIGPSKVKQIECTSIVSLFVLFCFFFFFRRGGTNHVDACHYETFFGRYPHYSVLILIWKGCD